MANLTSQLVVRLKDGVSGPAHKAARSIKALDRAARTAKGSANGFAVAAGSAFDGMGMGALALRGGPLAGAGLAAGAALYKASSSALSLETAMYEVEKATNSSGEEARLYEQRILDLARATGNTKEELASLMASAGFAGRPVKELARFTEYAAKATTAWGTSAEETGQAMAVIGNIYGASQTRIEEIGDAINTAADISATREKDLLEFIKRTGASGKQAGLSAEQVLAFGAAMGEAGTSMEVAATGFETLLNFMKLGREFSDKAGDGLAMLGIDSDKMRKQFVAKPLEATLGLLNKIQKVADPMKRAEILTNIFGKEYQDDIQKLMNSMPRLNSLLGTMANRANYLGSVDASFQLMTEKDFNRLKRANESIDVMMLKLGRPLKIGLGAAAEEVNKIVDGIERGDNIIQRIYRRVESYNNERNGGQGGDRPLDIAGKWIADNVVPNIPVVAGYNAIGRWAGGSGDEAAAKGREAAILERLGQEEAVFRRAEDLRSRLQKMNAPGARFPAEMKDSLARELEMTERQALEIQRQRFSRLGINQTGGATAPTLGGAASFGFGPGGTPVDTSGLEAAKGKATEAGQALQGLNTVVAPQVNTASIDVLNSKLDEAIGKLSRLSGGIPQQTASREMGRQFAARRRGSFADYEHA